MPFWPLKVDNLFHVFPAFVKVQRKEVCPLYKILSTLAGVYAQWTTPRTCIDYQLECMLTATPVQAIHVRTERTIVNEPAKRRCVSPAPREFARNWDTRRLWLSTAFRFSCKNTCRGDMYFVVSAVVLCSWKWSCFRGAGETHRRFAGSFTIIFSVLTCTAWTGVAVACTLTDSIWFQDN